MERKIGEIFEYNGEWYQCVEDTECIKCINCCFYKRGHKLCTDEDMGACNKEYRSDTKSICFKKLKKVGEPYMTGNKLIQRYKIYPTTCCINVYGWYYQNLDVESWTIDIEIKETNKDMEEKKLNLKPFDIQKAREGNPVCTRDGRKARILCFDRVTSDDYSKIVACITSYDGKDEYALTYGIDGYIINPQHPQLDDLMMFPEKKEGWVNVYKVDGLCNVGGLYSSKEEAEKQRDEDYIATVKINWEE